jgi:hypothetical protein
MTRPTPGPWRIFDAFTDIEIVTDYCDGRQSFTESIVQFKGQRNARANAAWIVCVQRRLGSAPSAVGDLRRDHNLRDDNDRLGWGRRQAQNGGSPDGDRWFESISLQR